MCIYGLLKEAKFGSDFRAETPQAPKSSGASRWLSKAAAFQQAQTRTRRGMGMSRKQTPKTKGSVCLKATGLGRMFETEGVGDRTPLGTVMSRSCLLGPILAWLGEPASLACSPVRYKMQDSLCLGSFFLRFGVMFQSSGFYCTVGPRDFLRAAVADDRNPAWLQTPKPKELWWHRTYLVVHESTVERDVLWTLGGFRPVLWALSIGIWHITNLLRLRGTVRRVGSLAIRNKCVQSPLPSSMGSQWTWVQRISHGPLVWALLLVLVVFQGP